MHDGAQDARERIEGEASSDCAALDVRSEDSSGPSSQVNGRSADVATNSHGGSACGDAAGDGRSRSSHADAGAGGSAAGVRHGERRRHFRWPSVCHTVRLRIEGPAAAQSTPSSV